VQTKVCFFPVRASELVDAPLLTPCATDRSQSEADVRRGWVAGGLWRIAAISKPGFLGRELLGSKSRRPAPHRNDFEISMLPQVKEREPDPRRNSGDSQRARYCSAQPEEVRHSTPAHTSASALFTSPAP
jgi:hypothetical protein